MLFCSGKRCKEQIVSAGVFAGCPLLKCRHAAAGQAVVCVRIFLKFRHGVPIPLWHLGHTAAGILPFSDGHSVIKPLPQETVGSFLCIWLCHLKVCEGGNGGLSFGV